MPRAKDTRDTRRWPKREVAPDHHTPRALTPVAERYAPRYYEDPDAIERICAFCTLEWADGGWQHDRACVLAAR